MRPSPNRLPKLATDAWSGGFVMNRATNVQTVDCCRGVLLAATREMLYLMRAGEHRLSARERPPEIGPVRAVAVEPARRPRLALAGEHGFALVHKGPSQLVMADSDDGAPERLAWGADPQGGFALYGLRHDRSVVRVRPDHRTVDELSLDAIVALAGDGQGTLAIASIDGDTPGVWVSRDGDMWHRREVRELRELRELDGMGGWELAVAGDAVAIAVAYRGVWVSRAWGEPLVRCEALGTTGGPLAFEGAAADAALFAAVHAGLTETVVRVDAAGAAARIAEIDAEGARPSLSALAWDEMRRVLWGALPAAGLVELRPPGGARALS
jgi:hypothetical protein